MLARFLSRLILLPFKLRIKQIRKSTAGNRRELFKMMSLALVMIAVAVLPAALATTATCTGALMAVAGVADKCFWYANLSEPMGIQFLSDLCQP